MIRFKSYFDVRGHEDESTIISISNSELRDVKIDGKYGFLLPSWDIVDKYKKGLLTEEEFTSLYREEIMSKWSFVKAWMMDLTADDEITMCCWEHEGEFCHRRLVAKMIRKWRPDLDVELK